VGRGMQGRLRRLPDDGWGAERCTPPCTNGRPYLNR
jgi:hypothetical protein